MSTKRSPYPTVLSSQTVALMFISLTYSLGVVFTYLPTYFNPEGFSQICPNASRSGIPDQILDQTLRVMLITMTCFFVLFKIMQSFFDAQHDVWFHVKSLNSYILCAFFALTILAHFPYTLLCFMLALVQMFLAPLLPQRGPDFSWKEYVTSAGRSLIWLVVSGGVVFLFLFGSILHDNDFGSQIRQSIVQLMMDFECMGSRAFPFLCIVVVPNLVFAVKILIN
jgi:hypothetical protein